MSDSLLSHHKGVVVSAKQIMDELRKHLLLFNQFWVPLAQSALVYPLPVTQKKDPLNVPWLPSLDEITFDTIEGDQAVSIIAQSLINFKRFPNDPALNIRRWPGILRLPAGAREQMITMLTHINQLKTDLKLVISQLPDGSRPLVLKKTFPGEHILAAYRHIHFATEDVGHLSFTWVGKTAKNTPIAKTEVLNRLEVERDKLDADDVQNLARINQDIETVNNTHTDLIERKMHAPSPQLAVFYENSVDKKAWDMLVPIPLPFFIAQDNEPQTNGLSSWKSSDTQKGSRSLSYIPIVERLRIYQKDT